MEGPARIVLGSEGSDLPGGYGRVARPKRCPAHVALRKLEDANLFFPEEMPDVIAEEALALWGISPLQPKQSTSHKPAA